MNTRKRNKLKAKRTPWIKSRFSPEEIPQAMLDEFDYFWNKAKADAAERIIQQKFSASIQG